MGTFTPFSKLEDWAKLLVFSNCVYIICNRLYALHDLSGPVVEFTPHDQGSWSSKPNDGQHYN
jgi:hypothetical protein